MRPRIPLERHVDPEAAGRAWLTIALVLGAVLAVLIAGSPILYAP